VNKAFLGVLAISLITTAVKAQISAVDPSNTYIVRPGVEIAHPSAAPPETDAQNKCPSNTYIRLDKLVCTASYSGILAAPERFYGLEIYVEGYLTNGKDGLLLVPFTKPSPGAYETIHVQVRPSSDARKPPIPPRLLPKLATGEWVRMVGTFSRTEGALNAGVGILKDAHDIVDLSGDPYYRGYVANGMTYLPDLHFRDASAPVTAAPQIEIAPDAH
jgi:hypothetical protein